MRTIRVGMLLIAAGSWISGQAQVSAGVKAGVPLTDFFEVASSPRFGFTSETKRYLIGPTFELRLPAGLGFELDVLYRRFRYDIAGRRTTGTAWEFPLLFKYRFPGILVRPFVDLGVSFDRFSGLRQAAELSDRVNKGFVAGAGFEIRALILRISPEIRYTRWADEPFNDPVFRWSKNQAEFLVGFTF
ncbi:MAG: PorT family protein [Acidobacteria bacterium]|nr:PorT family protein [Acidobacteriota bacterium]